MLKKSICTAAFLAAAALTGAAHAEVITFNLDQSINGATPADSKPWLTATITDLASGGVELVMTNNLSSGEFVYDWLFNTSATGPITAKYVSGFAAYFTYGSTTGTTSMQAGSFNMSFACSSSNSCPSDPRFSGGTNSIYDLTGTGLTAASFLVTSGAVTNPSLGKSDGGYYTAADVRGLTNTSGGSGSIGATSYTEGGTPPSGTPVPEPMPLALLGMGLAAFAAARRKKK
jgi:hypothetical protein